MKKLIEKINPPGIEKDNRRKLFDIIGNLGDVVASDSMQVLRNFFPLLSDQKALADHGEALMIPRYSSDTEESYRARVATAAFYMFQRGTRGFLKAEIAKRFESKDFRIIEDYMHLAVKVLDISETERVWLYEFLDKELDPNISITLIDWFRFIETVAVGDTCSSALVSSLDDAIDNGFCLDGRTLLDHGREVLLNGDFGLSGAFALNRVKAETGTWTGVSAGVLFLAGTFLLGGLHRLRGVEVREAARPGSPAFLCNGKQDLFSFSMASVVSDTLTFNFRLVGGVRLNGMLRLGEGNESLLDDFVLNVRSA